MTLDWRWLSSELCASIAHEQCRSQHTSQLDTSCGRVWSEQIWWVDQWSPKLNQTCVQSASNPQWSPCWCHSTSSLEYSKAIVVLQASYNQLWPFDRYYILTDSELHFIHVHLNCYCRSWAILVLPIWIEYLDVWDSSRIILLSASFFGTTNL
jgi:hypothetical protein